MVNRNLYKRLGNTRKRAVVPKGTSTINQAKKIIQNTPLTAQQTLNKLKTTGFLGGTRKQKRKTYRRRH